MYVASFPCKTNGQMVYLKRELKKWITEVLKSGAIIEENVPFEKEANGVKAIFNFRIKGGMKDGVWNPDTKERFKTDVVKKMLEEMIERRFPFHFPKDLMFSIDTTDIYEAVVFDERKEGDLSVHILESPETETLMREYLLDIHGVDLLHIKEIQRDDGFRGFRLTVKWNRDMSSKERSVLSLDIEKKLVEIVGCENIFYVNDPEE
ncbi:MAG: hypothetical protein PHS92_00265 [Candidatus Gracilibacteria bacterium]|nr:hypothetical protein [Candidatus Gracilibacteria bacterium]